MKQLTKISLLGLTCSACERVVSSRIKRITGVDKVEVSVKMQSAVVTATRPIAIDEIKKALEGTHYTVISNS